MSYGDFCFIFAIESCDTMKLPIRHLNEDGRLADDEKSQLRYVFDIMYGEGKPYCNDDWSVVIYPSEVKIVDIPSAVEIFAERYNTGQILCAYKYEDYINNSDLQNTIKGLGLDSDAFWLLVMFCLDYACSMCFDSVSIAPTRGDNIETLVDLLSNVNDSEVELSLKTDKGKIKINSKKTISLILEWIKRGYEHDKDLINRDVIDVNKGASIFLKTKDESDSVLIWYFAYLVRYFFRLKPHIKGKRKKGDTASLSKGLLISKLVYYLQLSKNRNFLNDTDTLKSFFKQYKDKDMTAFSNVYPT